MTIKSSVPRVSWCLTVLALVGAAVFFVGSPQTSAKKKSKVTKTTKKVPLSRLGAGIPGTGTGAVPDNDPGNPLVISFDGSGLSGPVETVGIDMTMNHSWVGDFEVILASPAGTEHTIMSRTGSTTGTGAGDSSNLDGLYGFNDAATGDWWAVAAATAGGDNLPNDDYRTTANASADATDMNATFLDEDSTGTWTLSISDNANGDTGDVTAANLFVTTSGPSIETAPGSGTGGIPDNDPGTPLDITFDISDSQANITDVDLDMTMNHSWVGDIEATLISPDGTEHTIMSRTGSTTGTGAGDSSNLDGEYGFNDSAAGDWWAEAASQGGGDILTPADYRTTDNASADATDMTPAFDGVDPNGTWTLRVTDNASGDTGDVTAANLTITSDAASPPMFVPNPTDNDFDGDGTTDHAIVRGTDETELVNNRQRAFNEGNKKYPQPRAENGIEPGSDFAWWVFQSNGSGAANASHGTSGDTITPADFDGDGITDLAVWRGLSVGAPSNNAMFMYVRSSDSTSVMVDFGQIGDNPIIVGDYDGDGTADPAVFRCGSMAPVGIDQCTFFYQGSAGSGITFVPWGVNSPFIRPYPGDFDGDGKMDFAVHRPRPGMVMAAGITVDMQFAVLRSSDGADQYFDWGNSDDVLVPGDFSGDGRSDFMIARAPAGNVEWWLLDADGATTTVQVFGNTSIPDTEEFPIAGDFDGDGATDIGVYRRNNVIDDSNFYILGSTSGFQSFEWGNQEDIPSNGWNVQFATE